jgi:hypothetical protein
MIRTFALFCGIGILGTTPAWGQTWNMCGPLVRQYEATHGIPSKLLTAISLVESGRKVGGAVVAWPWTINTHGKPYVFATKAEAIRMVRKLHQAGIRSIDVGCMQVNLKKHPDAFPNLEAAFDPATNIDYAARFLKNNKMKKGTWRGAVALYHSSIARFHLPYTQKVLKTWAKVQNNAYIAPDSFFDRKTSIFEMAYSEIQRHEGEFIKNVDAPSGRRLPVVVRFAPYKGFGGIPAPKALTSSQTHMVGAPKIIRGQPAQRNSKLIINMGLE